MIAYLLRSLCGLFVVVSITITAHVIPNHIANPSKYQAKVSKVLKEINKRQIKEKDKLDNYILKVSSERANEVTNFKPLPDSVKKSGSPVLQLYVRRAGTGPWSLFQEDLVDHTILNESTLFCEGGISAESIQSAIECNVALKVFGKGLGDPLMIEEVTKLLPHFKKLKSRLFEFGFKIFSFEEHNSIFLLTRSMTNLPMETKKNVRSMEAADPIDVDKLMTDIEHSAKSNQYRSFQIETKEKETLLESKLNNFLNELIASHSNEIVICSDGSALLNGKRCVDATAGLVIISKLNSTSTSLLTASNKVTLKVENAGGMVLTPFDAELIAGLTALSLARIIGDAIIARNITSYLSPEKNIVVTLLTDSRSLLRSVRTGEPPNANYTSLSNVDMTSKSTRKSLFDLYSKLIQHTNLKVASCGGEEASQQLPVSYSLEWVPGHPEKRDANPEEWSFKEKLMWMADAAARQPADNPKMTDLQELLRDAITLDATDILTIAVQSIHGASLQSSKNDS